MRGLSKLLLGVCVTGLMVAQAAQAQIVLNANAVKVEPLYVGSTLPPDVPFYDNTDPSQRLFSIGGLNPAAPPTNYADDVPMTGLHHVTSAMLGYVTSSTADRDMDVKFYTGLLADDSPDPDTAITFTLTGLPGSPDGQPTAFAVMLPFADLGLDFDWTASTASGGGPTALPAGYTFNWVGMQLAALDSPLFSDGGTSHDLFWSDHDLRPTFDAGSFFWFFGGSPVANFFLSVSE